MEKMKHLDLVSLGEGDNVPDHLKVELGKIVLECIDSGGSIYTKSIDYVPVLGINSKGEVVYSSEQDGSRVAGVIDGAFIIDYIRL